MLYAELWTEGKSPWNWDLIYYRIALEKAVPPVAQFSWKLIDPTEIL